MLAQWTANYSKKDIIKALREALKMSKLNMNYIDRILVNGANGK